MFTLSNFYENATRSSLSLILLIILIPFLLTSCGSGNRRNYNTTSSDMYRNTVSSKPADANGKAFVSPKAADKKYYKVAVTPFRASDDFVGSSIADMLATEILKTYRYELIERSQIEQILQEQSLGIKGVTEGMMAMTVGKVLDVQGVIVGTVLEYGTRNVDNTDLPAVGINVRMIDTETGSIVWTVSGSKFSNKAVSVSSLATELIESMVQNLKNEWIRSGDTFAINIRPPRVLNAHGQIRKIVIDIFSEDKKDILAYSIFRGDQKNGPYEKIAVIKNRGKDIHFEDKKLQDQKTYYYKISSQGSSGFTGLEAEPFAVTTSGPPGAVVGIQAKNDGVREVQLTWHPSSDKNVKGYKLYRSAQNLGPFEEISNIKGREEREYLDRGISGSSFKKYGKLEDNTRYYYKIKSYNEVKVLSPDSQIISATTKGQPKVVSGLTATDRQPRKVTLRWQTSSDPLVKGYALFRSMSEQGFFEEITRTKKKQNEYTDMGKKGGRGKVGSLTDDTTYYYQIKTVNVVDVLSLGSVVISATTKALPLVVTGFSATQNDVKQVVLAWNKNPETGLDRYEVYRGNKAGSVKKDLEEVDANHQRYIDDDLKDNQTFYYKIRAVDQFDLSGPFSVVISSTTKPKPTKPENLQYVFNGERIQLRWKKNRESDITKYMIYKKNIFDWELVGESREPLFLFQEQPEKGTEYIFQVVAIDSTNLESDPSTKLKVKVPK